MAKWLQFHLNEGDINGQQLLPKEKLKETYLPQMPSTAPLNKRDMVKPTYPVTDISMAYNMGWETNVHRGKFYITLSVHYESKQKTKEKLITFRINVLESFSIPWPQFVCCLKLLGVKKGEDDIQDLVTYL